MDAIRFQKNTLTEEIVAAEVMSMVKDVVSDHMDKIVKQLEAEEYDVNCNICDYDSEIDTNTLEYYEGKEEGIREAIEIVKGGAV